MITRVKITGLEPQTIDRIDKKLGTKTWRFDIHEPYTGVYDVEVANCCDVLYASNSDAKYTIVLCVGELTTGLERKEFNQIIGT